MITHIYTHYDNLQRFHYTIMTPITPITALSILSNPTPKPAESYPVKNSSYREEVNMVGRQGKRNNQEESIDRKALEREYCSYSKCLRWKKKPRHQHGL